MKENVERMFLTNLLYHVSRTARLVLGYMLGTESESIHVPPESSETAMANNCESTEGTASLSFGILYRVDVVRLVFDQLDSSSLALAACTCRAWRDAARLSRGSDTKFRLRFTELLCAPTLLVWTVVNLGMRDLPEGMRLAACTLAARHGCLEIVRWAHNTYHSLSWTICSAAAKGGHLEVLKWARANGCEWTWLVCAEAAKGGHLELLKWARANGCAWNDAVCDSAAEGGHLAVLQWARSNGCPWNEDLVCAEAAENGHFEILQWMLKVGTRRGWQTCAHAAMSGSLKLLQWAHENGFAWDQRVCLYATQNGHLEVLQWARANGCPWDRDDCLSEAWSFELRAVATWIATQAE